MSSTSSTIMAQTTNHGLFTCSYTKLVTWHHKSRTWHPRFDYTCRYSRTCTTMMDWIKR